MDAKAIRDKFGDDFIATDLTFKMGMHHRFTAHIPNGFGWVYLINSLH